MFDTWFGAQCFMIYAHLYNDDRLLALGSPVSWGSAPVSPFLFLIFFLTFTLTCETIGEERRGIAFLTFVVLVWSD